MRVFLYIFLSLLKINVGIFITRARHICGPVKYRSSRMDMFGKKDVLKKFAENAEKTCDESFFNEVLGLLVWNIVEKRLQHTFFPLSFAKLLRTSI